MSTSAESATLWLKEKQPSDTLIEEMITKLNDRIEHSGWPEEQLQGSLEALDILDAELQRRRTAPNAAASLSTEPENPGAELDTSPLVSHDHIATERPPEEKRALFEQLKQQLQS